MAGKQGIKVHVIIEENGIQLAEMVTVPSGGRHEFVFSQPIYVGGRNFQGFALEMHIDQTPRHVAYKEFIANAGRPLFSR